MCGYFAGSSLNLGTKGDIEFVNGIYKRENIFLSNPKLTCNHGHFAKVAAGSPGVDLTQFGIQLLYFINRQFGGFSDICKMLIDRGEDIIEIEISEYAKIDGGLTCLSLRF